MSIKKKLTIGVLMSAAVVIAYTGCYFCFTVNGAYHMVSLSLASGNADIVWIPEGLVMEIANSDGEEEKVRNRRFERFFKPLIVIDQLVWHRSFRLSGQELDKWNAEQDLSPTLRNR